MEALAETCGSGELRYSCLVNGALFVMMELIMKMQELSAVNWDIMCTVSGQISVKKKTHIYLSMRYVSGKGKSNNSTAPRTTLFPEKGKNNWPWVGFKPTTFC